MERLRNKKISFSKVSKMATYLIIASFLVLGACQDKGSGKKTVTGYHNSCVNCGNWANSYTLGNFTAQSANGSVIMDNMILNGGRANVGQQVSPHTGYYNQYNMGSEMVTMTGTMRFATRSYSHNGCMVPEGIYNVSTLEAGAYDSTYFTVPLLLAQGPVRLEMRVLGAGANHGAFLYNKSNGPIKSMYGVLQVTKVNGMQCSSDFYTILN